jgi:uncharacterized protein
MHLVDEFTVAAPPDQCFAFLLDLERVAPCVPGGEIGTQAESGEYPGKVSVKLGPMKFVYSGTVRIAERDPEARRAVIEGQGRASGGAESAKVRSVMEVVPEGDGSRVRMTTDLDIKGRAAQMGQGVIADVSRRLIGQAATCLEARMAGAGDDSTAQASTGQVDGVALMASVVSSKVGDSLRRLGGRKRDEEDPEDRSKEGGA